MTDRELLELAAKAAGIGMHVYLGGLHGLAVRNADGSATPWNPLESCDDALRLAIKRRMHLGIETCAVSAWSTQFIKVFCSESFLHQGDDRATRRAITRVAAEEARLMP